MALPWVVKTGLLGLLVVTPTLLAVEQLDDSDLESTIISKDPISSSDSSSEDPVDAGINVNCFSRRRGKLLGGVDSDIVDFPYVVAILVPGLACSGSLISAQWVLTSARCALSSSQTIDSGSANVTMLFGDKSISGDTTSGQRQTRNAAAYIYHHVFSDNDIGLIKLDQPVQFGAQVRPICLSDREPVDGELGVMSGWSGVQPQSATLQNVTLTLISRKECKTALEGSDLEDGLTDNTICAGRKGLGQAPCLQDYGGPLVSANQGDGAQIGVVTWAPGTENCWEPAVYTRVDSYFDWIVRNVNKY